VPTKSECSPEFCRSSERTVLFARLWCFTFDNVSRLHLLSRRLEPLFCDLGDGGDVELGSYFVGGHCGWEWEKSVTCHVASHQWPLTFFYTWQFPIAGRSYLLLLIFSDRYLGSMPVCSFRGVSSNFGGYDCRFTNTPMSLKSGLESEAEGLKPPHTFSSIQIPSACLTTIQDQGWHTICTKLTLIWRTQSISNQGQQSWTQISNNFSFSLLLPSSWMVLLAGSASFVHHTLLRSSELISERPFPPDFRDPEWAKSERSCDCDQSNLSV